MLYTLMGLDLEFKSSKEARTFNFNRKKQRQKHGDPLQLKEELKKGWKNTLQSLWPRMWLWAASQDILNPGREENSGWRNPEALLCLMGIFHGTQLLDVSSYRTENTSQPGHLRENYLTSLNLSFLACKIDTNLHIRGFLWKWRLLALPSVQDLGWYRN